MTLLSNILLMIHLLSMCMGVGFGLSVLFAGTQVKDVGTDAGRALLGVMKKLSAFGRMAIALLWLTGILMIAFRYPNPMDLGWTFFVKISFVVLLTISVFYAKTLGPKIATGKMLGLANAGLAALAIVFAVLTFSG